MLGSAALLAILIGLPLLLGISWRESLTLLLASITLVAGIALGALFVVGLWRWLRYYFLRHIRRRD